MFKDCYQFIEILVVVVVVVVIVILFDVFLLEKNLQLVLVVQVVSAG